jgi:16S rRNA (cytosine967-C5)-methyltransferase
MKSRAKPAKRSARTVSPARLAAFEILRRVEDESAYASVLLASGGDALNELDRGLAYELVLGTLRWQLWLDTLIEHYSGRSAANLDGPVRRALRLAFYQLRFLDRLPASAIVNESVNLAYVARMHSAAGFINAVLRRAIREPDFDPAQVTDNPLQRLSITTSHPLWLIERWSSAFGFDEAAAFAEANNRAAPVAFRLAKPADSEAEVLGLLASAGATTRPSQLVPGSWRVEGAGSVVRELFRDGRIYIQDEASQMVAHIVGIRPGERVLDVCAAPGSKTTHLAALSNGAASIVAGDLYEHRLQTVKETQVRAGVKGISLLAYDATAPLPLRDQSFDRVLVDAPCSGTGTLRRNPEIRWRISNADILEMAERQKAILSNSARVLRPGGSLVYSTCSVEPEENEEVVASFLKNHPDFRQGPVIHPKSSESVEGALRTWPHKDGSDGFFVALLVRQTLVCRSDSASTGNP